MNCLFKGVKDERPSLVNGYGIFHDWQNSETKFLKHFKIQNDYFTLYDVYFPKYFCLSVDGKLLKERDNKNPFQEAKRIVHQDSSAYVDFLEEEDEVTMEFFSYEDKSKIGSSMAFKALRLLSEGFFNPKSLCGSVPHLNTRYGSYKKLLSAYEKFGFTIGKEIVFNGTKSTLIFLDTEKMAPVT